ncbi:hypothetical protein BDZ90DRAFT_234107 [Jaminaea rosea]|uniref:Ribosomal protein/NADH dehydrogenase domain-containing protein n=1 Tax=Jaminaea rosea TaxID=1569628 RepID=A0A316UKA2_9BASI|nr:hypothetical protein BDZ90DRAFT_234107 [Jaminaea rosea]PWN25677.1 hypothetical protein BDZ90DRAFT_234107 [Jaminaea rosea]
MATPAKPSQLSKVLARLNAGLGASKLSPAVRSLRVRAGKRHGQVGERQFIKEVLPRLAYANPTVRVDVQFLERGQGQGKAKEVVAATTTGEEGETGDTVGSDAVSAGSSSSEEASSVEIDFGNTTPPRKIYLTAPGGASKPAGSIVREILELARFQDAAAASTSHHQQQEAGGKAGQARAPEPSSTNLMGSAEGQSTEAGSSTPM